MSSSTGATKRRKLDRSASTIIASASRGYHILKIDGYSHTKAKENGKSIKSGTFTVGDHSWYIRYYPNGDDPEFADYISFYLFPNVSLTKTLQVQYDFRFIDDVEEEDPLPALESAKIVTFEPRTECSGFSRFIKREDLERSGHLKDDSFVIRCDIAIINKARVEDLEPDKAPTTASVSLPPPSDLHRHLGDLLSTGKGADVVFQVGGDTFQAHRCVLAARSLVFSAELFGPMKESAGGCVRIDDMEAHVFKAMLFFVYTDSLPEMTNSEEEAAMSQHLLVAADRYGLERLKLICEHKLCSCIEATTVATVLALAEQHHCHGLKKACLDFLSSPANLTAVLASDGFEYLNGSCPSVVKELIAKLGT